jgi:hypothetical protein
MENDPRMKRKLSDHALELIMRDLLHNMQGLSLDMQAEAATAMAATEEPSLASGSLENTPRGKN